MKIQYRTQGTGSYATLGDDAAGDLVSGFLPRMTGIAQATPLFRANNQLVAARGNRLWELKGTIEIDHGTAAAAMSFIQTEPAGIPDFVDVQILQGATTVMFSPAVFVGFDPVLVGQSSRITYAFVASNLTLV